MLLHKRLTELYTKQKVNIFVTMQPVSTPKNFPKLTSSQLDSLVSHFRLAAEDLALLIQEVLSFMRSSEWLKPNDLLIFYLKTCQGYSITKGGKHSEQFSLRFMSWGILLNGVCLTACILESRNSDVEYILSDFLMSDWLEEYSLSPREMERITGKSKKTVYRKE